MADRTLYKMHRTLKIRYSPVCTDIGWAIKQAVCIEKIFSSFTDATARNFDVPVYSGQIPPTVTMD